MIEKEGLKIKYNRRKEGSVVETAQKQKQKMFF